MEIKTTKDLREAVRSGPYAWPGGYPIFGICSDGEALCFDCIRKEYKLILRAVRDNDHWSGWRLAGVDINYEDNDCYCANCGRKIESAYNEVE